MRKFLKICAWVLTPIIFVWVITLAAGPKAKRIDYGVTFSEPYAVSLGLDWKQTLSAILTDLKPKRLRLSAYWDDTEKQKDVYDFTDLDTQVQMADKADTPIILALGRRLPRWPECHDPSWISNLSQSELQDDQLSYMETVVRHYQNDKNIVMWQVENEAFLSSFGPCPPLDVSFLDKEIALVKSLDPSRPILITDSGELDYWIDAGNRGDTFGTTYYRYVYSDVLKRYWTNWYFFPWFYRFKAGILEIMHQGKPIMIAELEAEPWTTAGITNTSISDQFKTMSLSNFQTITSQAAETGFSPQILWGAEWWYWMETKQDHPEFWQAAEKLINN
jgi:Glycosyl hydrolases family 2, TIM barrel domain